MSSPHSSTNEGKGTLEATIAQALYFDSKTHSSSKYPPAAQLKMEELFTQWLRLDSTRDLIESYLTDQTQDTQQQPTPLAPPRSPPSKAIAQASIAKKTPHWKLDVAREDTDEQVYQSVTSRIQADSTSVPRFYLPPASGGRRKRALSKDMLSNRQEEIDAIFQDFPQGIPQDDFVSLTKDLCGFPSFFNALLFHRILALADSEDSTISKSTFIAFWQAEIEPYDPVERFFRLVKQPSNTVITPADFMPILTELLTYHPGLEFLAETSEFQEKYALTVSVRIFYSVDKTDSGEVSLRELRQSNLVEAFTIVDEEEDINKVNSYFSYEHFYVLYCKFWELDTDHDFLLTRDDLIRYGGHALTRSIVDRVFEHGKRPFNRCQVLSSEERMKHLSYEDFIYFMLSEEDKSNKISLRYWFDCVDLNQDNVIRADEMRYFYTQQLHRMEYLGHEVVPFEDILCQLADLIHPQVEGEFYLADFLQPTKVRVAGVFFNVLFNLSKFVAFEQRDPFLMRQQMAEPELTDWDRYARSEYARLAMEEEERECDDAMDLDEMDNWYGHGGGEDEDDDDDSRHPFDQEQDRSFAGVKAAAEAPF